MEKVLVAVPIKNPGASIRWHERTAKSQFMKEHTYKRALFDGYNSYLLQDGKHYYLYAFRLTR